MFLIECKAAASCQQVQIDDLSKERVSAQIRIKQPSDFRWRRALPRKSLEMMSGVILILFLNRCNQGLQPNWSQMKCDV